MLATTKKYGSLALIVVLSAWLLYVAVGSTSFQICIADKENKQAEQASKKNSSEVLRSLVVGARVKTDCFFSFLYDNRDAVAAIATVFIALFTFTLYQATIQQARITFDALKLARDEFVSTWRPKLRVRNIVLYQPQDGNLREEFPIFTPGRPLVGKLQVVNIGGTTAKIKQGRTIVFWNESGLPMELPYARSNIGVYLPEVSLAPGKSIETAFQSDVTLPANASTISTAVIGALHLYVMGSIEYDDESCIRRRTNFCREYRRLNWQIDGRFYPVDDPDYEHEE